MTVSAEIDQLKAERMFSESRTLVRRVRVNQLEKELRQLERRSRNARDHETVQQIHEDIMDLERRALDTGRTLAAT